jgi:hypothetical protein
MSSVLNKRGILLVISALALAYIAISGTRWILRARTQTALSSCIAHLKQIDGAKATWALEHQKKAEDIPKDSDLFGSDAYIRDKPKCPRGGTYTIGRVGEWPRCTVAEHNFDFGLVRVVDVAGKPVVGAEISVQSYDYQTAGDGTSVAPISLTPNWIIVSKPGYQTERVKVPDRWPLTVILKPDLKEL